MRKKLVLMVVVLILALGGGYFWWYHSRHIGPKKPAGLDLSAARAAANQAQQKQATTLSIKNNVTNVSAYAEKETDPNKKAAYYLSLSNSYTNLKDSDNALLYAQKAVDIHPTDTLTKEQVVMNFASLLSLKGNYSSAASLLQTIAVSNPSADQVTIQNIISLTIDAYKKSTQPDLSTLNRRCVADEKTRCP